MKPYLTGAGKSSKDAMPIVRRLLSTDGKLIAPTDVPRFLTFYAAAPLLVVRVAEQSLVRSSEKNLRPS
jgi:hypothetical protein